MLSCVMSMMNETFLLSADNQMRNYSISLPQDLRDEHEKWVQVGDAAYIYVMVNNEGNRVSK